MHKMDSKRKYEGKNAQPLNVRILNRISNLDKLLKSLACLCRNVLFNICIFTAKSMDGGEVRSILKSDHPAPTESEVRGILKSGVTESIQSQGTIPERSILKSKEITEVPTQDILEQRSILKKESRPEVLPEKGVLKKESSFDTARFEPEKSSLKKESTFEPSRTEPEKSILKESTFQTPGSESDQVPHGILKSPEKSKPQGALQTNDAQGQGQTVEGHTIVKDTDVAPLATSESLDMDSGSTNEDESVEKIGRIKNEAVARRRMQREMRKQQEQNR